MPSRYSRDFSRDIIKALAAKGATITGATWLPGTDGSYANGERGYTLDARGTHVVRTYAEVRTMAAS